MIFLFQSCFFITLADSKPNMIDFNKTTEKHKKNEVRRITSFYAAAVGFHKPTCFPYITPARPYIYTYMYTYTYNIIYI